MSTSASDLYNPVASACRSVEGEQHFTEFLTKAKPILELRADSAVKPLLELAEELPTIFSRCLRLIDEPSNRLLLRERELHVSMAELVTRWRVQPRLRTHFEEIGEQARTLTGQVYLWRELSPDDVVVGNSYSVSAHIARRSFELIKEPLISVRQLNAFLEILRDYLELMAPEVARFALPGWENFVIAANELEAFVLIHETEL